MRKERARSLPPLPHYFGATCMPMAVCGANKGCLLFRRQGIFVHRAARSVTGAASYTLKCLVSGAHRGYSGASEERLAFMLEKLDGTLVLFGRFSRLECAQISPLAGPRIDFSRIEPILAGFEFADHAFSSPLSVRAS